MVTRLYLSHQSQAQIAERLGVTQQTISLDLKAIQREWKEEREHDLDIAKARELARIDKIEIMYLREWQKSRRRRARGIDGTNTVYKTMLGDPRYLAGVQWCIDKRCKLLGLDAPARQELSGPGGKPIEYTERPFADVSDDELYRLISEHKDGVATSQIPD